MTKNVILQRFTFIMFNWGHGQVEAANSSNAGKQGRLWLMKKEGNHKTESCLLQDLGDQLPHQGYGAHSSGLLRAVHLYSSDRTWTGPVASCPCLWMYQSQSELCHWIWVQEHKLQLLAGAVPCPFPGARDWVVSLSPCAALLLTTHSAFLRLW